MKPARFGITLKNTKKEEIKESAGKGHTDADIQYMHEHVSQACKDAMDDIERRSHKQKGKFKRFCNSRDGRRNSCGQ